MNFSVDSLFNLNGFRANTIFDGVDYPWNALRKIESFIIEYAESLPKDFERIEENIWIGKGTTIEKSALLKGPAIIGYDCEIRQSAFIRGDIIVGDEVVIGNSTEIKNSILFNKVQVPHFNYVGDSILGYKSHLGAGVILSNLRSDKALVKIKYDSQTIETGLRKLGALIGDYAEIGCNSVLNPGTIIGRGSIVYPLTSVRGCVPEKCILKSNGDITKKN